LSLPHYKKCLGKKNPQLQGNWGLQCVLLNTRSDAL
jgi:hypothetical protein